MNLCDISHNRQRFKLYRAISDRQLVSGADISDLFPGFGKVCEKFRARLQPNVGLPMAGDGF